MLSGLLAACLFAAAALIIGLGLARIARAGADSEPGEAALVNRVNALLPQTQCAQCGYPGCRPYAQAIIDNDERINRCPPGGESTIHALAELLGRPAERLDSELPPTKPPQVAIIDEHRCIGCALCLPACPVDAIVGAHKYLHTVITEHCTGCELCLPPCPVDCIELAPREHRLTHWVLPKPA